MAVEASAASFAEACRPVRSSDLLCWDFQERCRAARLRRTDISCSHEYGIRRSPSPQTSAAAFAEARALEPDAKLRWNRR